jgi:putative phage-type endonuclease
MIILPETQTREEWLARRRTGVGSSDAAAIMGVCPWSGRTEKLLEKLGIIDGYVRMPWEWRAMEKGRRLEPEARRSFESWTGIFMPAANIRHSDHPELIANCDGLNTDAGRVLEIKCPGRESHKEAVAGRIPDQYLWQCVHLLMVSGMEWLDYWSYHLDEKTGDIDERSVCMKRDLKFENRLMEMELSFWKDVLRYRGQSNVIQFRR